MISPRLIDGKAAAVVVFEQLTSQISALEQRRITPGLAVVVVGNNPASLAYVRSKAEKCAALGIYSVKKELPESTSEEDLIHLIHELNNDPAIHGILVQSPPPSHIREERVINEIDPAKDVDGFHPVNVAKLALSDPTAFVPCTPLGCQFLLANAGIETSGAHVAVIGRSMIVGKSLALLLMQKGPGANATVTVLHSGSRNMAAIARSADIVIAALGRPRFLGPEYVREGAVVIDVGINRIPDPSHPKGSRLVGDVDFDAVAPRCEAITPVPGGVGPMTIAMLMRNTVIAAGRISGVKLQG
jgi:methylenetetrahydrofolate dehydrogenase (NADP+)/methenyltetrahydrofolate cyclohydrolase